MKSILNIALILVFTIVTSSSCSLFCKKGNGNVITQTRKVAEFDEIEIEGQATVYIEQDSVPSILLKIDSNLVEYIQTEVSGMKLKIKEDKCLEEISEFEIIIKTTGLARLSVDGSVKVKGENTIRTDKLSIKATGSGEITLNLDADDLNTTAKGSGVLKLIGRALQFDIELNGTGSIDAFELQAKEVDADVSGSGSCKINVSEKLYGEVSGSGKIFYKGNPKKVRTDVTGSGSIQAK